MPNLVQQVGVNYMNESVRGAVFLRDNQLLQIVEAGRSSTICENIENRQRVDVPNDFFTGWKVFAAHEAGYRRLGEHIVGYCSRVNSTRRGLRDDTVAVNFTPATALLLRLQDATGRVSSAAKLRAMIAPTFDNLELSLPRMLRGEQLSIVLSANLVIEPAVGGRADQWYNVLFKERIIGKLNRTGRVTWNDASHANLIPSLMAA